MEEKKNLCAMIPVSLHKQVLEEKEALEMKLADYVAMILNEHFSKEGKTMANGTRTLAFQISEELFGRIKEHLRREGISQKDFVIRLIEQALEDAETEGENPEPEASDENEYGNA